MAASRGGCLLLSHVSAGLCGWVTCRLMSHMSFRDLCTSGTEKYVDGHHGPSLNVLCVPWGHTGQVGQRSMLTGPWGIP